MDSVMELGLHAEAVGVTAATAKSRRLTKHIGGACFGAVRKVGRESLSCNEADASSGEEKNGLHC
jgi:hypothetical protein